MDKLSLFEYGDPKTTNFKKLSNIESIAVMVPKKIICNDCGPICVAIYSYIYVRRGLDNILHLSVCELLEWMNKKENKHPGGINYKVVDALFYMKILGIINFDETIFNSDNQNVRSGSWSKRFEIEFIKQKINDLNKNDIFAIIYWDEINKILNYNDNTKTCQYKNNINMLLMFSYLRMVIGKRPNKIIQTRNTNNWVEAWACYFKDIAECTGLSVGIVSVCANNLKKMELIYFGRTKLNVNGILTHFEPIIFVNTYKREGGYLLASGRDYYMGELNKELRKLTSMRHNSKIDN